MQLTCEEEPPGNAGIAKRLDEKYRGRWLVLWSWWSQTFLAWPTWIGASGCSLETADPQRLEQLMIAQEERLGVRPLQHRRSPRMPTKEN